MTNTYIFDVGLSSHCLLRQGIYDRWWVRIVLTDHPADDPDLGSDDPGTDAALLAAHMAHTVHGDLMVTSVLAVF